MAYYVNKTDGTAILVLDGTKNTSSTSLTLFGRLVESYGENTNENFVWLLENFALGSPPPNPLVGQLWYDTSVDNIKSYDGTSWTAVGSDIVGNVSLSGNLFVGSNLKVFDNAGNSTITNLSTNGNISFIANVGGTLTNVLNLNGSTGLLTISANATNDLGIPTKIYVDSEVAKISNSSNVALNANIAIINANLAVRVNAENNLLDRITGANADILLRDTITRVNSINSAIDTAIISNIATVNSSVNSIDNKVTAANVTAAANVVAANIEISNLRSNITAVNVVIASLTSGLSQTNSDLSNYALKASPAFSGSPTAPTPPNGTNTTRIATTEFVQTAISSIPGPNLSGALWQGSRKFISTLNPTSGDGSDGDFWFKYN